MATHSVHNCSYHDQENKIDFSLHIIQKQASSVGLRVKAEMARSEFILFFSIIAKERSVPSLGHGW